MVLGRDKGFKYAVWMGEVTQACLELKYLGFLLDEASDERKGLWCGFTIGREW